MTRNIDIDLSIEILPTATIEAMDGLHRVFLAVDGSPLIFFPPHTTFGQAKAVRDSLRAALTPPVRTAIGVAAAIPAEAI